MLCCFQNLCFLSYSVVSFTWKICGECIFIMMDGFSRVSVLCPHPLRYLHHFPALWLSLLFPYSQHLHLFVGRLSLHCKSVLSCAKGRKFLENWVHYCRCILLALRQCLMDAMVVIPCSLVPDMKTLRCDLHCHQISCRELSWLPSPVLCLLSHLYMASVLVSYRCCNKSSQFSWLKITKTYN